MQDINGRDIAVGNIVIYTGVAYGRNLPPLQIGEVIKLTSASVKVYRLNKDFTRIQMDDGYMRDKANGSGWTSRDGEFTAYQEFVKTGHKDRTPESVRWYSDRFYIVK